MNDEPWLEFRDFLQVQKSALRKRAGFEIHHQVGAAGEWNHLLIGSKSVERFVERMRSPDFEIHFTKKPL